MSITSVPGAMRSTWTSKERISCLLVQGGLPVGDLVVAW